MVSSTAAQLRASPWLMENGPRVLESLLRVTIFRPFGVIPHTDADRTDTDSSGGAGKRRVPHTLGPDTLHLLDSQGTPTNLCYSVTGDAMSGQRIVAREQDCALFLLDAEARIAVWYPGAEIVYQYKNDETIGRHMSILGDGKHGTEALEEFGRSIQEGRLIAEGDAGARASQHPYGESQERQVGTANCAS